MSVTLRKCEHVLNDDMRLCGKRGGIYCPKCRQTWCPSHETDHAELCAGLESDFPRRSNAGRPVLADPRSRTLSFRVTESEFRNIRRAASVDSESVADWFRMVVSAALEAYEGDPALIRASDATSAGGGE